MANNTIWALASIALCMAVNDAVMTDELMNIADRSGLDSAEIMAIAHETLAAKAIAERDMRAFG